MQPSHTNISFIFITINFDVSGYNGFRNFLSKSTDWGCQ